MPDRETNIVELLTRYPVRHQHDPSENRLTAALAAVLSRSPNLARALAKTWGVPAIGRVEVNPQAPTRGERSGFIDLEMRFGEGSALSVVWIEAKLHSPLSGADQIERYAMDLKRISAKHRRLVLLAPAGDRSRFAGVAPLAATDKTNENVKAHFVSWQQIYGFLRAHRDVDDWFSKEVLQYMTQIGVEEPGPLNKSTLLALELKDEAAASLAAIVECAADAMPERWKSQDLYAHQVGYQPPTGCRWGHNTRFVMGVDEPGQHGPTYFAGLVWPAGVWPFRGSRVNLERWEAGFVDWQTATYGREEWLWRAEPLRDLIGIPTLAEQGSRVAKHAADTFMILEKSRTQSQPS